MVAFSNDNLDSILKEIGRPVHSANPIDGFEHDDRVRKGEYNKLNDQVKPPSKRLIEKILNK
jgi:hypothetical protein